MWQVVGVYKSSDKIVTDYNINELTGLYTRLGQKCGKNNFKNLEKLQKNYPLLVVLHQD